MEDSTQNEPIFPFLLPTTTQGRFTRFTPQVPYFTPRFTPTAYRAWPCLHVPNRPQGP